MEVETRVIWGNADSIMNSGLKQTDCWFMIHEYIFVQLKSNLMDCCEEQLLTKKSIKSFLLLSQS